MCRITAVVLCVVAVTISIPARSEAPCQYAHVIDPCAKKAFVLNAGETEATCFVTLDQGPAGAYEPRAVDHATLPRQGAFCSFVSQGPFLRVISPYYIDLSGYDPEVGLGPTGTVDLAAELGLAGIELAGLHAAGPAEIDGRTRYLLYAAATLRGATDQPWIVVFDQELLAPAAFDPANSLWAAIPLCPAGSACEGQAIDVAAGARLPDGSQELFVSLLVPVEGQPVQRFLRVVFQASGAHEVSLDPWNDEGLPFDGSEPGALGLEYESLGLTAHGVFQTSSVVSDLHDGSRSCELGPGDPTDVAVWGPGAELDDAYVQFVTVSSGSEEGSLFGYPESVCPVTGQDPAGNDPEAPARVGADGHAWIIHVSDPDDPACSASSSTAILPAYSPVRSRARSRSRPARWPCRSAPGRWRWR